MRIIISPAKKMNVDPQSFPIRALPPFLPQARRLKEVLQAMEPQRLQRLWRCNDAIARLNISRLEAMDLERDLTCALLAYEGIQYRYMAPGVMEAGHLSYLGERLRIVSGFYGLLSPFDGVVPYRLEMQARLAVDGCGDLYAFWGDRLARRLASETDFVLNLASKEYSRAVLPHLPARFPVLTCTFGERRGDKVLEKGTMCKMARGQMVRWLAENQIARPEDIRAFGDLGYRFSPGLSSAERCVFLKDAPSPGKGDWNG